MTDITSPRNLNPARRHCSYPRVIRRARQLQPVKRPGDIGIRAYRAKMGKHVPARTVIGIAELPELRLADDESDR